MADVSRNRGQLILVTGLILAVVMVALVLLLNTAIYTENLASRGSDQGGREVLEYRASVVGGVGELIDRENAREHDSYSTVEDNVKDGVSTIDNYTARNYALGGTVVRINQTSSSLDVTEGRLVRQSSSRQFQNASGGRNDWTLATGVDDDEVRDFRLTVTRASLEPNVDDALNVRLEDTTNGDTWQVYVYDDGTNVTVATSIDGGSKTDVCSVAGSEATIDLTRGTIEDEPCSGLDWAGGIDNEYEIGYGNGENATGTYNVTLDDAVTIDAQNVDSGPSATVYHVPAVYSVSFDLSYRSSAITYRTTVRVAPGEKK